jgi:hypothetical protein
VTAPECSILLFAWNNGSYIMTKRQTNSFFYRDLFLISPLHLFTLTAATLYSPVPVMGSKVSLVKALVGVAAWWNDIQIIPG